jgi:hypothetical protein
LGTAAVPKKDKKRLSRQNSTAVLFSICQHWLQTGCLLLVILKGSRDEDGLFSIGAMNRLAVVPQRGLREPFRVI